MTTILLSNASLPQANLSEQIEASLVQRIVTWGRRVITNELPNDRNNDVLELDEIIRMTGEW
jgi:hypothetical protein